MDEFIFKPELLPCPHCKKVFKCRYRFQRHMVSHDNSKPFECAECKKKFKHEKHLNNHYRDAHVRTSGYQCKDCGESFVSHITFTHHVTQKHGEHLFSCDHCTDTFSCRSELETHLKKHSQKCKNCDEFFTSKADFKIHSKLCVKAFVCEVCKKEFLVKAKLVQHMRVHSDDLIGCKLCDKRYKFQQGLRLHMRREHDDKNMACADCPELFSTQKLLDKHRQVHTGVNLYGCDQCSKSFRSNGDLRRHVRVVHEGVRHKCLFCDAEYTQTSGLNKHMMRGHLDADMLNEGSNDASTVTMEETVKEENHLSSNGQSIELDSYKNPEPSQDTISLHYDNEVSTEETSINEVLFNNETSFETFESQVKIEHEDFKVE